MTTRRVEAATAVDELLAAITAGTGGSTAALYTDDAVLDATVPGWRLTATGGPAIAEQYGGWFADPGRFSELERIATATGEVVSYLLRWQEDGVEHASHHCHLLTLDEATGRISKDVMFCGGRWPAPALDEMGPVNSRA